MTRICFVCLGNICRSPMAEFVMKDLLADRDDVVVESRATSSWEHGNSIHQGTQAILKKHAITFDQAKTSQQISMKDLADFDFVVAMDEQNVKDLKALSGGRFDDKISLLVPDGVPDPWYTGDFDQTYDLVSQGCKDLLAQLSNEVVTN
ncbi:low molecular weight protein-tyrosine-phosphatase [Streptococcus sp. sy018]|uniref:low molecular weight protein-tyrosine-phosphatase n=1 Tax=Streptococcus sp. sy018 TaxID=2600147 RepID=UPI0011B374F1|nr:low molecular weight protein-tyrosine-phosphatase [Streptococcus sp. sy018]TWS94667.1 low molecular weight phosphotyrosine protein phosphatase [Streptococcus sp. sy018]